MKYKQAFNFIQDRAWALHPAKLEEVNAFIAKKIEEHVGTADIEAATAQKKPDTGLEYTVENGIATLPIYGVIGKRMNMFMEFSGGTSTELIKKNLTKLLNDKDVDAIVLDVDSPGGSVDGTKELADFIFASRGKKPIIAYANGLMASAAYWIASAAHSIVGYDTAEVGSIGVALTHYDYSEADKKEGVVRTVIYAGKYKRIASDEKPLSDAGREYLQGYVDQYYSIFVESVAKQRGVDVETVLTTMADGKTFIGFDGLKNGLVDSIGDLESAHQLARLQGGNMEITVLQEKYPETYKKVFDLGAASVDGAEIAATASTTAATNERTRVLSILKADAQPEAKLAAIEQGLTLDSSYKIFFEAEKKRKDDGLAALAAAAPQSIGSAETVTVPHVELSAEDQAEKDWTEKKQIRDEFRTKASYLAFVKADAQGLVRIMGNK